MSKKYALIIGNTEYTDPGLAQLTAPGKDAEDFAQVLKAPDFGAFDEVATIINEDAATAKEAIEEFFNEKTKDDLLVLYFSGHGVKDEVGNLYLAVKNTRRTKLRSTGIESGFVRAAMDQSRSKRQVLILDCCNSGAFAQGTKAETGGSVGTASAFHAGSGQIILTASDATQFAWEGDKVIGETNNSLFTHFLVKGIKGEADRDGDGQITVDELYDYAFEQVRLATPKQTPSKFSTKQQGEIVLRQGISIGDIPTVPLPKDLLDSMESPYSYVREAAVNQLIKLLNGKNLGLARSAREALEQIAENDDSRTISRTAFQAVEALRQADESAKQKDAEAQQKRAEDEARRTELQKAEGQRLLNERAKEAERQEKEKAERFAAQKIEEERLAKQKAEEERIAQQKAEAERVAQAKAEADRKAQAEADRLAVQKAEEERLAQQRAEMATKATPAEIKSLPAPTTQKKPVSKGLVMGIAAVILVCVAGAGIGLNGFLKSRNQNAPISTSTTQAAVVAPATEAPTLTPTPVPTLGIGSTLTSEKDGMTLLYVPAGEFTMGSDNGAAHEKPVHKVTLDAYWIDQTEVTNKMYALCVEAGVCKEPIDKSSYTHSSYYGNSEYDNYPVLYVDWNMAKTYCSWADRRLPTEAEWEKAARGTDGRTYFPWGNDAPNNNLLNYNSAVGDTTEVGKYPDGKSIYGALDMAGNVWEWVNDWYDAYPKNTVSNSDYGTTYRVLRGGSWLDCDNCVRSASRNLYDPSYWNHLVGFRCASSP